MGSCSISLSFKMYRIRATPSASEKLVSPTLFAIRRLSHFKLLYKSICLNIDSTRSSLFVRSKLAQVEVLQIDQYIWSILRSTSNDVEEVTIDALANWKPSKIPYNVKVSAPVQRSNNGGEGREGEPGLENGISLTPSRK